MSISGYKWHAMLISQEGRHNFNETLTLISAGIKKIVKHIHTKFDVLFTFSERVDKLTVVHLLEKLKVYHIKIWVIAGLNLYKNKTL